MNKSFKVETPMGGFGFSVGEKIPKEALDKMSMLLSFLNFNFNLVVENNLPQQDPVEEDMTLEQFLSELFG